MFCSNFYGKRTCKGMNICVCVIDSLCHRAETYSIVNQLYTNKPFQKRKTKKNSMMIKEYSRKSETYLYRNQKVIYGINIKYFSSSLSLPEATLYVWFYLIVMVAHVRIKTETEI